MRDQVAYRKAYYAAHREKARAAAKAWHEAHREENNAKARAYHAAHPVVDHTKDRERYAALRNLLNDAKATGCVDCGNMDVRVLDFDHTRGVKLGNVSNMMTSRRRLVEEIAKCDIRCANCHRIRTWERLRH